MKNFNLQKKKEKGFTLIEVLLAMSISLIGFSSGFVVMMEGYKHLNFGQGAARVQQQAEFAMERMVKELQETAVSTIAPDPSVINAEENSSNIISFASARNDNTNEFETDDNTGMPIWSNAIVYFRDEESNKLYRYKQMLNTYDYGSFDPQLAKEQSEQMATSITNIKFWFSGDELLNIEMEVALNSEAENPHETVLATTIKLRN
jgi:prepilin-type N-terminal cleavage/methylation domain-containing protein